MGTTDINRMINEVMKVINMLTLAKTEINTEEGLSFIQSIAWGIT